MLVVALLVTVAVRATLVTTVAVVAGSMQPLLQPGDRVLVWRLGSAGARSGDVVVVDGTGSLDALGPAVGAPGGAPPPPTRPVLYVKRVVGAPGQRLACCASDGRLLLDGQPLDEPYVSPGEPPSGTAFDVVVPDDRLWLLGDHRSVSADSRSLLGAPGGGTVARDRVVGRVVAVAWPPDRWGRVQRAVEPASERPGAAGAARPPRGQPATHREEESHVPR